jgi:murein DD-endopeptidase MepM/ murein hydrolase activator NlpD
LTLTLTLTLALALTLLSACTGTEPTTAPLDTTPTTTSAPAVATTIMPAPDAPSTSNTPKSVPSPEPEYTFPFVGREVSYGTTHHDYPAIDVFGCGAMVVAPTDGTVVQVRSFDPWDSKVNAGSTRGGMYVSMLGADGVRYYFAHLALVLVAVGQTVAPGTPLGPMGQTGDARNSACHAHVGFSWTCPGNEWKVRRGKIWPMQYLDAWRAGDRLSPTAELAAEQAVEPSACDDALAQPDAALS